MHRFLGAERSAGASGIRALGSASEGSLELRGGGRRDRRLVAIEGHAAQDVEYLGSRSADCTDWDLIPPPQRR